MAASIMAAANKEQEAQSQGPAHPVGTGGYPAAVPTVRSGPPRVWNGKRCSAVPEAMSSRRKDISTMPEASLIMEPTDAQQPRPRKGGRFLQPILEGQVPTNQAHRVRKQQEETGACRRGSQGPPPAGPLAERGWPPQRDAGQKIRLNPKDLEPAHKGGREESAPVPQGFAVFQDPSGVQRPAEAGRRQQSGPCLPRTKLAARSRAVGRWGDPKRRITFHGSFSPF